jgi:hypothetical protein
MGQMAIATNQVVQLTEALVLAGGILNDCEIKLIEAISKEDKRKAKIEKQIAKGKFAEIKAKIKAQKEIINSLKILIKAEHNSSGGF